MFKKLILGAALAATLSTTHATDAYAKSQQCLPIGGVAIANFFDEGEGKPMVIAAVLTGSVQSAAGKITGQRKTETGLEMDMEHYFTSDTGGTIYTKDLGILTAVPGKEGRFMMEISYHIQEGFGRGTLRGYKGSFKSFGLVDLRDTKDLKGLVRYSGEICK
ncbi:MAG: hypothetical protein COB36_12375 [Alphaproteobacteria bacterium]|nr:MAG: hypothetical protein COB36_12375 [Alphaproteobacteria bacterium]